MADAQLNSKPLKTTRSDDDIYWTQAGGTVDKKTTLPLLRGDILDSDNNFRTPTTANCSVVAATDTSIIGDRAAIIASSKVKAPNNLTLVAGYGISGISVPSEVIVTPAVPVDGRTMVSGGSYLGPPLGRHDPVYEIQITTPTSFLWQKTINGIAGGWSSPVTITGAAQTLDYGVTVTFSTTTNWIDGYWSITIDDDELTQNRKFELDCKMGDIEIAGTLTPGHLFSDYAEMFENKHKKIIPVGTIVTFDEDYPDKIIPGKNSRLKRNRILGVISASACVLAGNNAFCWSQKFLTDEFNRPILDKNGEQKINPDHNPRMKHIKRSERPREWSAVALLGQVPVRVGADVDPGEYVDVYGVRSRTKTRLLCMKIITPYDESRGYAVAKCLLR